MASDEKRREVQDSYKEGTVSREEVADAVQEVTVTTTGSGWLGHIGNDEKGDSEHEECEED